MARNDLDRNSLYRNSRNDRQRDVNRQRDFNKEPLTDVERKIYALGAIMFEILLAIGFLAQAYVDLQRNNGFGAISDLLILIIMEIFVLVLALITLRINIFTLIKQIIHKHKDQIDQGLDVKNNIDDIK